jgi:hypothetical protein
MLTFSQTRKLGIAAEIDALSEASAEHRSIED